MKRLALALMIAAAVAFWSVVYFRAMAWFIGWGF